MSPERSVKDLFGPYTVFMERAMGIEPTSEAWVLSETATYAAVSVRSNMSIRKERYWLRNRELVHGAKMYVMPQLGVRISWRERCKPGPGIKLAGQALNMGAVTMIPKN